MHPPKPPRAATLHDVADDVGVSPRTVSRVVNDEGGFSEATRRRVLDAVDRLHYRPNAMARALITRRTGTLAFIGGEFTDPFFPEVAQGLQAEARERGLSVLVGMSGNDTVVERDLLDRIESHAPDGVIVFPVGEPSAVLGPSLDRGLSMVVVDAPIEHPNAAALAIELDRAGLLAAERFRELRRTRSAMLSNARSRGGPRRREGSFLAATDGHVDVERVDTTADGGYAGMVRVLARSPDVDAVFAYNDLMALGAMRALRERGRTVPGDVAVIGVDGVEMGAHTTPSLTTVVVDRDRLGREAVRLMVALIGGEAIGSPTTLDVELLVRDSA